MTAPLRVVSHGGGVQTTALLVLAAQQRIDFSTFIFANVGDDSEHPSSLRYLREIAIPYAAAHGITVVVVQKKDRDTGAVITIRGRITDPGFLSDLIPVHLAPTGRPASRSCTGQFKIQIVGRWLRANGASPRNKATVAVGISKDELHRANPAKANAYENLVYPLLQVGDPGIGHPVDRSECKAIITAAGLPLPGKSACYFCPFHRPRDWQDMARYQPEVFESAAQIEDHITERRRGLGKNPVFLSEAMIPLREAFGPGGRYEAAEQLPGLEYDQHCDNGWCMT